MSKLMQCFRRTIYGVITALFGVITLAYIAVDSYRLTHGCSAPGRVCPADNRLGTAYYAIYLDLSLAAVITMIVSLAQMSSRQVASRAHKIWIPILGISQILWINLMVFKFEYWVLESHVESEGTSVALEFLIDFFQAVAYLSVILFGKVLLLLLNQLMARRSLTMEARQSMPRTSTNFRGKPFTRNTNPTNSRHQCAGRTDPHVFNKQVIIDTRRCRSNSRALGARGEGLAPGTTGTSVTFY